MRVPALAAAAAVALLALAHPSGAATKPFHVADAAGDANGLNSQSIGLPVPSTSTGGAEVKGADILGLDITNQFRGSGKTRKPAGFKVVLHLAAPLQAGTVLTVTMNTSVPCGPSSTIQLGAGTTNLAICQSEEPGGESTDIGTTQVVGNDVVWDLVNVFKAGTKIDTIAASSSVFVLGVFDEASTEAVFTYGK